jgi:hypothetical protein
VERVLLLVSLPVVMVVMMMAAVAVVEILALAKAVH